MNVIVNLWNAITNQKRWITRAKCLNRIEHIINDSRLTWRERYELIFSDQISRKVFALIELDYVDPDFSYKKDVMTFVEAFRAKMI